MPIENRNLTVRTKLLARYKKQAYHAEVVEGEEGKVRYRLKDGREFKSPSAAGTAITNKACNGWAFWSVAQEAGGGTTENEVESYPWANDAAKVAEQEAMAEEAAQGTVGQPAARFRRVPNQRGVIEGSVRLYCDECKTSFTAPEGQQPDACPEGHRPDGSEVAQEE